MADGQSYFAKKQEEALANDRLRAKAIRRQVQERAEASESKGERTLAERQGGGARDARSEREWRAKKWPEVNDWERVKEEEQRQGQA